MCSERKIGFVVEKDSENGKRQIFFFACLECSFCHKILPAPGIDPQ